MSITRDAVRQVRDLARFALRSARRGIAEFRSTRNLTPRATLHEYWKRPGDTANDPGLYVAPVERSKFLYDLVRTDIVPTDRILEIGCNVGRNLNYLHEKSFRRLSGIEISPDAVAMLRQTFPALAADATLFNTPVEDVIKSFEDRQFELVYTMAVLEHIHPSSDWIFRHIVRITAKRLVTIEDEKSRTTRHFPRNYQDIFERLGMQQVASASCDDLEGMGPSFIARIFAPTQS